MNPQMVCCSIPKLNNGGPLVSDAEFSLRSAANMDEAADLIPLGLRPRWQRQSWRERFRDCSHGSNSRLRLPRIQSHVEARSG